MTNTRRNILVTSALPYANGPIHLGHLVEYIQTDIWTRYLRSRGHIVYYVCADDAHGTPIMLQARKEGISPEVLIEQIGHEHREDFDDFQIQFNHYHTTHSPENRHYSEYIYRALDDRGHIAKRTIRQAYDPEEEIFCQIALSAGPVHAAGHKINTATIVSRAVQPMLQPTLKIPCLLSQAPPQ